MSPAERCGLPPTQLPSHRHPLHTCTRLCVAAPRLGGREQQGEGASWAAIHQHCRQGPHLDGISQRGACIEEKKANQDESIFARVLCYSASG